MKIPCPKRVTPYDMDDYTEMVAAFNNSETIDEVVSKFSKTRTWIQTYLKAEHSELTND